MWEFSPVDVKKALLGVRYPITSAGLLRHVTASGAMDEVVAAIRKLPDRSFGSATEVVAAIPIRHWR